jgi:hypothetical protein
MAFPDALVVLSTRPAEAWYRSAASTIFQLGEDPTSSDVWRERFGFDRLRRPVRRPRSDDCRTRGTMPPSGPPFPRTACSSGPSPMAGLPSATV